jgi:hypothetical protein
MEAQVTDEQWFCQECGGRLAPVLPGSGWHPFGAAPAGGAEPKVFASACKPSLLPGGRVSAGEQKEKQPKPNNQIENPRKRRNRYGVGGSGSDGHSLSGV